MMRNPRPVNLMTPDESRSLGWAAESRDSDGHLMTQHAPFESRAERLAYIAEEAKRGHDVTIFEDQPNDRR